MCGEKNYLIIWKCVLLKIQTPWKETIYMNINLIKKLNLYIDSIIYCPELKKKKKKMNNGNHVVTHEQAN